MAAEPAEDRQEAPEAAPAYRRVGHKGADAIVTGNTAESFDAAVEVGVDMIELDVLRAQEGRLIVAHDHHDALMRKPMDLAEALDLFLEPPLDEVEIDCDLKLAGREAELAGRARGPWAGRAGDGLDDGGREPAQAPPARARPAPRLDLSEDPPRLDPIRLGRAPPSGPASRRSAAASRPSCEKKGPELGVNAVWAYHPIITPRLVDAAQRVGVELIAWTVDDAERMRELLDMGVDGICSNDPRLFEVAEEQARGRRGSRRLDAARAARASAWCRGARRSATRPRRARSRAGPRRPTRA